MYCTMHHKLIHFTFVYVRIISLFSKGPTSEMSLLSRYPSDDSFVIRRKSERMVRSDALKLYVVVNILAFAYCMDERIILLSVHLSSCAYISKYFLL